MIVFSSKAAALREGFRIDEFDRETRMFIVVKEITSRKRRRRMRAFAHPGADDITQRAK